MSDTDELDAIKQRKRQRLMESADRAETPSNASTDRDGPTGDEPIHVTGPDHLQSIVDREGIVLADFYADWCGPCKMLAPIVEQLAVETTAAVAKVDVDANPTLAAEHGVRGVPTVVLFAGGAPVERLVGVRGKAEYEQLIEQHAA